MNKNVRCLVLIVVTIALPALAQVDTTSPTVNISSTASNPTNSDSIPITISFSEAVSGFTVDDIVVVNGSLVSGLNSINYHQTIGTGIEGNANNQFNFPTSATIHTNGKLYVADQGNRRIQIFNADGSYYSTIGTGDPGSGNNQFRGPRDVAFDDEGKIYVADAFNHRIQIFNADGSYYSTIGTGTLGSGNNQLYRPSGVAIADDGKIYVGDQHNHRVQIFNADGTFFSTIGVRWGNGNNQFHHPSDITIGPDGKIYEG